MEARNIQWNRGQINHHTRTRAALLRTHTPACVDPSIVGWSRGTSGTRPRHTFSQTAATSTLQLSCVTNCWIDADVPGSFDRASASPSTGRSTSSFRVISLSVPTSLSLVALDPCIGLSGADRFGFYSEFQRRSTSRNFTHTPRPRHRVASFTT